MNVENRLLEAGTEIRIRAMQHGLPFVQVGSLLFLCAPNGRREERLGLSVLRIRVSLANVRSESDVQSCLSV